MAHTQQEKDALLGLIPNGAARVKVITDTGHRKWRPIAQIEAGDTLVILKGIPIYMMSNPGRHALAKTPPPAPPASPLIAHAIKRKKETLHGDALLGTIKKDAGSDQVLQEVILGLADEAASLKFERSEAESDGKETSALSIRRVSALKAIAETWLKRKDQYANKEIDFDSPVFKTVFKFIMETFKGALLDSNARPEMIETVFAKFSKAIESDDWLIEAKNRTKNA
jgi:hypothetical protein